MQERFKSWRMQDLKWLILRDEEMPEFATGLSLEKLGTLNLCKLSREPRMYPALG